MVVAAGLAALVIPFVLPRTDGMSVSAAEIEEVSGKRGLRSAISAIVLLAIVGVGIYSAFDLRLGHRYALALYGGFFAVLAGAGILPPGRARSVFVRILEGYLVVIGIVIVIGGLLHLWTAALEGRALMPSRTYPRNWVSAGDAPGLFWFSVACGTLMQAVALYLLRDYFANWLHPVSRALPQADDEARL
jgi:hypothetical protein